MKKLLQSVKTAHLGSSSIKKIALVNVQIELYIVKPKILASTKHVLRGTISVKLMMLAYLLSSLVKSMRFSMITLISALKWLIMAFGISLFSYFFLLLL